MEVNGLFNPYEIHRDDLRKIFDYRVALPNAYRGEDLTMALSLVRSFPDLDFGEYGVAHTPIGDFRILANLNGDIFYVALDCLDIRDMFSDRERAAKYLSDRYRYLLALSIIQGACMVEFGPPYPYEEQTESKRD